MFAVREKHKWIVNSMLCQVDTREDTGAEDARR